MAQVIAKGAANLFLKKQMKQYKAKQVQDGNDPYFAMIEDPRKPGKFKKVKKTIPAYIPEHDALILANVRKTAYRLDMCLFDVAGIRFGWEAVIGIVPAFGDLVGVLMALSIWRKCQKVDGGLDSSVSTRMLINIIIDFVVGLIPFLGDLADAAFKCNTKNVRLLEVQLEKKYGPGRDQRNLAGVDREKRKKNRQSGIYHPQDPPPATVFEDYSDEEEERQQVLMDQHTTGQPSRQQVPVAQPTTEQTSAPKVQRV